MLTRLADISPAEIVERRRELRRVVHMLTYSEQEDPLDSTQVIQSSQGGSVQVTSSHVVEDAATAAVAELQRRVLGQAHPQPDGTCPHESEMSADPTVSYTTVLNRLVRG